MKTYKVRLNLRASDGERGIVCAYQVIRNNKDVVRQFTFTLGNREERQSALAEAKNFVAGTAEGEDE